MREIHIPSPLIPANSTEVKLAKQSAQEFLDAANKEETCGGCKTSTFCAAVITNLATNVSPNKLKANEELLRSHGIEMGKRDSLCVGKLAHTAIRQVRQGEYWVATNNPLNNSPEELQISDALKNATQALIKRIQSGQAI